MNVIINKIRDILQETGLAYFSEDRIDYEPELQFFTHAEYEIIARDFYMHFCKKKLSKKDFLKKASRGIHRWFKISSLSSGFIKRRARRAAAKLWKLNPNQFKPLSQDEIRSIKIDLITKFRRHCCPELDCTDNASRRFFFRSPIVYVREINTYVLTNYRKYIHDEQKGEYKLDETVKYEILNYCPFCGENLYDLRIFSDHSDEIIRESIKKWRDEGECKLEEGNSYTEKMSFYGINAYESFWFVSEVLAKKYSCFDDKYGVDNEGILRKNADFITVPKLFKLAIAHNWLVYCDPDPIAIDREGISDYFSKKLSAKSEFSEDEVLSLTFTLNEILWLMFHEPASFDELLENKI